MEVLGVFGATDVPGRTGLCGRSVPKGRPVLWSGVVGSKPGFSVSGGVAAPILFAGAVVPILFARAVVMELAAMAHVADNINPIAVKHIEVSFILVLRIWFDHSYMKRRRPKPTPPMTVLASFDFVFAA